MNKVENKFTKALLTVLFIIVLVGASLIGLFYFQKLKIRNSNPQSSEEVIKKYYRAISYGEYEKAISLYTEHYKKQAQDCEIGHAALHNKKPLTIAERMKKGRPFWTLLLAPLVDLVPCDFSEYQANGDSTNTKGFRVKCYETRQYFVILKKEQTGNWKIDGPPGTGP